PASTGKSYIIHILLDYFQKSNQNSLLMALTGIAAQNIGGATIHSTLQIIHDEFGFHTLIFRDPNYINSLSHINTIIINEVSMVSSQLLTFISKLFELLHKNNYPFGGINIILVGDLAQLPPIRGSP
ncbi:10060_t:CDS:1, partial [Dentiscutata heterogama]